MTKICIYISIKIPSIIFLHCESTAPLLRYYNSPYLDYIERLFLLPQKTIRWELKALENRRAGFFTVFIRNLCTLGLHPVENEFTFLFSKSNNKDSKRVDWW